MVKTALITIAYLAVSAFWAYRTLTVTPLWEVILCGFNAGAFLALALTTPAHFRAKTTAR